MSTVNLGIIMNGVTGRMGTNQHLMRSMVEIIRDGGVWLNNNDRIMPDPVLIGRNIDKLEALSRQTGIKNYSVNLDDFLKDERYPVYFDAQTTEKRAESINKAIDYGKHIYCEKPVAGSAKEAIKLFRQCKRAGLKNGVVQDKLWLPGLIRLNQLIRNGFIGKVLSVKADFGYWVFEGFSIAPQRPSWNYKKENQGGIILDMFCHWNYILENLFGKVLAVSCMGSTLVPKRVDENGKEYMATADDIAFGSFLLENNIIAQINSSWCTRVRRDDLLTIQVDGSRGSAVAGLRECYCQDYNSTPRAVWNPDIPQSIDFNDSWKQVSGEAEYPNAFRAQWELFLKHVVIGEPFPWTLLEGAKGVQLAEKAMESWKKKRWIHIPELH